MLVLTDRMNEGSRLRQLLEQVAPCAVVALHQASAHPARHDVIVCDVAFDNVTSAELLRAALAHHRTRPDMPVLCLTRDPSHLTLTQARAAGATAILPYQAPPGLIVATVRELIEPARAPRGDTPGRERPVAASIRDAGLSLADMLDAAKCRKPVTAAMMDRGGNAVLAAIGKARIRAWLDVVWNYDDLTYQHCLLVAGLVAAFALRLGVSLKGQRLLAQAALVHDIGKAHIPTAILNKAGRLTDAEMTVMRTHALLGYQTLASQPGMDPALLDVVRHHHEYLDGSGYPDHLRAGQISNFVRLVTICDIYAALIERRPYKAPLPPEEALAVIDGMGAKLDGGLVRAFHALVRDA